MTLDPLARRGFASAADAYERGRPGYAPQALALVRRELGLSGSSRLLDLAAGTGQLSRLLVTTVGSLVAVEPSAEMRRVLRPGGGLALLWNVLLAFDPPWDAELRAIVARHRAAALRDERRYGSGIWRRTLEDGDEFEALSPGGAEHEQRLDREGLVAQIASWSYIASLPEPDRRALLDSARRLTPAACTVRWRTEVHWTRRVSRAI